MKISEALLFARQTLNSKLIDSYKIDGLILLCHVLGFSKEKVIFNPDLEIELAKEKEFLELVDRRLKFEPISHLIQKREFYKGEFFVNSDVLDPRPDSEMLIELVLEKYSTDNNIKILELGVGSGCLIITLLSLFENADGIGLDISCKALEIAKKNAEANKVLNRLKLVESDLFEKVDGEFDLIISNPPYIKSDDIGGLQNEVKNFEPILALDGGIDGLDFYHEIARKAGNFLKEDGNIIIEIGMGQRDQIIDIFAESGLKFVESKFDFGKIERILMFSK